MISGDILIWIILVLLAAGAVFMLLPALVKERTGEAGDNRVDHDLKIYRDQLEEVARDREHGLLNPEQAQAASLEIERRLLAAGRQRAHGPRAAKDASSGSVIRRLTIAAIAVFLPFGAFALYLPLGSPGLPGEPYAENQARTQDPHAAPGSTPEGMPSEEQIAEMLASLTARLEDSPGEPEDWGLLARSYVVMGRIEDARAALEKAITHFPDDARLLSSLARVFLAGSNQDDPEAIVIPKEAAELFMKVLTIEPENIDALWFAGLAEEQGGRRANAARLWRRLLALLPPDSANRAPLEARIQAAEAGG